MTQKEKLPRGGRLRRRGSTEGKKFMNRRIAVAASTLNLVCVAAFALSMLVGSSFFSYFSSFFIALSYVAMAAGYCLCAPA